MPATRPIENEPRTTEEREDEKLLRTTNNQVHKATPTPVRHARLSKTIAGRKVGGSIRTKGGSFSPRQSASDGKFKS